MDDTICFFKKCDVAFILGCKNYCIIFNVKSELLIFVHKNASRDIFGYYKRQILV